MASSARIEHQEGGAIRDELCARVDQLERDFRLLSVGELGRRADAVRRIARNNDLIAVGRLASGLGDAIAAGGRGAAVQPWFDGLREALGCERQDEAAASAFLASVSMRLAG